MMATRAQVMALPAELSINQVARILCCGRGSVAGHRWRAARNLPSRETSIRAPRINRLRAAETQTAILAVMGDGRIRNAADVRRELPLLKSDTVRWALGNFARSGLLTRIAYGLYQDQST